MLAAVALKEDNTYSHAREGKKLGLGSLGISLVIFVIMVTTGRGCCTHTQTNECGA